MEDARERFEALRDFDDVVICEIMRYGVMNEEAMVPPLQELYRKYALQLPTERRTTIFNHIKGLVETVDWVSVNALLPFIVEELVASIVSTAVIDLVSLAPMRNGDPMNVPMTVVDLIRAGAITNVGAAFGGLLCLGDSRVCRLLVPLRDTLNKAQVQVAIHCQTDFMHASTADFYLDWLEGLDDDQEGLFAIVAAGLGRIPRHSPSNQVVVGPRPIPSRGVPLKVWREMKKAVPLSEYAKTVASRLYAIERAEAPPKVMPHVIAAWGLKPLSDPRETAELSDRAPAPFRG